MMAMSAGRTMTERTSIDRVHRHAGYAPMTIALTMAASMCALSVIGASPAAAQTETIRTMLGAIGLVTPDREAIEYRERAPLVVPREMKLRPPEPEGAARRNAAWPNDPDVARRNRDQEEERRPVTNESQMRTSERARLSAAEIASGRVARSTAPVEPRRTFGDNSREEFWVRPDVLQAQGRLETQPELPDGVEPERRSLTDPPAGFRRPTNSDAARRARAEPVTREDEADPQRYLREQAQRR